MDNEKWTEKRMQSAIVNQIFKGALMIVPNCSWTGYECDLLIVDKTLRIIDIEVKISRADFKMDAKKDKWWKGWDYREKNEITYSEWHLAGAKKTKRDWPEKVWKHYFAMPAEIYDESLLKFLPSETCGIIVFKVSSRNGQMEAWVKKPAKPCRDAKPISAENAIDIARLAAMRMWATYAKLENAERKLELFAAKPLQ